MNSSIPDEAVVVREWESLGEADPMWAVLTDPGRRHNKWQQQEFFACGEIEIEAIFRWLAAENLELPAQGRALDFGCGVGRLTRPLAQRFGEAVGVDAAESMVRAANSSDRCPSGCRFIHNSARDLSCFQSESFDFALTCIVLQHLPPTSTLRYLEELLRVLKPGALLVFQIPVAYSDPPRSFRDEMRIRYQSLRATAGIRTRLRRLVSRSMPDDKDTGRIRMFCVPEEQVRSTVAGSKGSIVASCYTNSCDAEYNGNLLICKSPPSYGFVSRMFVVERR